jgi:hypothetical protein
MSSKWKTAIFIAPLLLGMSPAIAEDIPIPAKRPDCDSIPGFTVADFSMPVANVLTPEGLPALKQLRNFKVDTIFRYYDHENETLRGKTLHHDESDAIIASGLKLGVVFQHHNDDPAKFLAPDAGTKDAERALKLADENKQPYGSAIYFGIDGPERHLDPLIAEFKLNGGKPMSDDRKEQLRQQRKSYFTESYDNFLHYGKEAFRIDKLDTVTPQMMGPVIARYFASIAGVFRAYARAHGGSGYKIGMYCTAAMCLLGDDQKFAEYFWISPEGRNDAEYQKFLDRVTRWNLIQQLPTSCPGWGPTPDNLGMEFDFNYVNSKRPNFGQWTTKRAQ